MKIADLCCGAGGAAMGLHQAFPDAEIVGVDIRPQPRFPFTFVQGDALTFDLSGFDFAWASPPCQEHSSLRFMANRSRSGSPPAHHQDILVPMRAKLEAWGRPWIMENVVGAPLRYSAQLCGQAFGLDLFRHRRFEAPFLLLAPPHSKHVVKISRRPRGSTAFGGRSRPTKYGIVSVTGNDFALPAGKHAMQIEWMQKAELAQAIPPAYSRYLAQFIPLQERVPA